MSGIDITPAEGNPFANPGSFWFMLGRGPGWTSNVPPLTIAAHEEAPSIDSSQPVVCRFCGAVRSPMGWLTRCLRRL